MARLLVIGGIVVLIAGLATGCGNAEAYRAMQETNLRAANALQWHDAFVERYKGVGIASVSIHGGGNASLLIDGGEYLGDRDRILLPVGVHEFRARWQDNLEAARSIYIGAALPDIKNELGVDLAYGRSVSYEWDKIKLNETRVSLQKPGS